MEQAIYGEGQLANPGSPGKMAVKTVCVRPSVHVCVTSPVLTGGKSFTFTTSQ